MVCLQYLETELETIPGPCSIQILLPHAPREAQASPGQLSVNQALAPAADSRSGCLQMGPQPQGPTHQWVPTAEPSPRHSQPWASHPHSPSPG